MSSAVGVLDVAQDPASAPDEVIAAWMDPIRRMLAGLDLSQGVSNADGEPVAGTRRDHLSRLLAETLMGYSDMLSRVRQEMTPRQQRVVKPLLDQAVLQRRAAAVRVATEGVIGPGLESLEGIELRVFEAAESVRLGVWG